MSTANEVQEVLFDFAQRCFVGEKIESELNLSKQDSLFDFLSNGELTVTQVHQMSENHKKILRELLSQYIIFLQLNQELHFPPDFLRDSEKMKLGRAILEYMRQHRWPFPQLLRTHGKVNA